MIKSLIEGGLARGGGILLDLFSFSKACNLAHCPLGPPARFVGEAGGADADSDSSGGVAGGKPVPGLPRRVMAAFLSLSLSLSPSGDK